MYIHEINFQDLEFPHEYFDCIEKDGSRRRRWLPYGMPTISPNLERCSFYLYGADPKTGVGSFGGSGCIVRTSNTEIKPSAHYAVTNWHVIAGGSVSYSSIRLNLVSGGSEILPFEPHDWVLKKDSDLAVLDLTEHALSGKYLLSAIPIHQFVLQSAVERGELSMGDDVFMVGMLATHLNDKKNTPVARFGNVSRPADDDFPIEIDGVATLPCHLVDMRSRTGYSGSPVFIYRTPSSDLTQFHAGGQHGAYSEEIDFLRGARRTKTTNKWALKITNKNLFLRFLGVHSSQFNEHIRARKEKTERKGDPINEGDQLVIPSSVTIVIPAHKVIDALNDKSLTELRVKRMDEYEKSGVPEKAAQPESLSEAKSNEAEQEGDALLKTMLDTPPKPKS